MEIIYTNSGLANNFGNFLELNRNLKKYPKFHAEVLEHELGHGEGKNNFWHDLKDSFSLLSVKVFLFSLRHPGALRDLSPFVRSTKGVYHKDKPMLYLYSSFLLLSTIIIWRLL